jgi:hypothetical protein
MMPRFASFAFASFVLAAGCGGAAAKPAEPAPLAVGAGDAGAASGARSAADTSRRGASQAVKKAWPFEQPTFAVYADLGGLFKTQLAGDLAKSVLALAGSHLSAPQRKCIDDVLANARELAVGSENDDGLAILRFEPSAAPAMSACVAAMGEGKPIPLRGAAEAWSVKKDVLALTSSGLLLLGPQPVVERALAARGSGASLAPVTLGASEYVAWTASLFDGEPPMHGALLADEQRFRLAGEADVPDERLAVQLEKELSKQGLATQLRAVAGDEAQLLSRVIGALDLKRSGKHVAVTFELRGTPAEQAHDLGAAAAIAISGVRRYISKAKQAEARNALGVLARDIVATWEQEDGKPRSKKKLVSFPAVPKTVPKGTKYQSSPADWKPWAPLHFEMSMPQYFQYEIKAAKDGESAEIIARGDLNGDGKTSQLKLLVRVRRPSNELVTSPAIEEIDPDE